jgi:dolichol-phosphate mannosyltransferase
MAVVYHPCDHFLSGGFLNGGLHRFLTTLVRMQGGAVVEIDVNHRPRPKGTPKYGQGLGRTFTALRDAWAVRWMQSRGLNYDAEEL